MSPVLAILIRGHRPGMYGCNVVAAPVAFVVVVVVDLLLVGVVVQVRSRSYSSGDDGNSRRYSILLSVISFSFIHPCKHHRRG